MAEETVRDNRIGRQTHRVIYEDMHHNITGLCFGNKRDCKMYIRNIQDEIINGNYKLAPMSKVYIARLDEENVLLGPDIDFSVLGRPVISTDTRALEFDL